MKKTSTMILAFCLILIIQTAIAQPGTPIEAMVSRQKLATSLHSVDGIFNVDYSKTLESVAQYVTNADFLKLNTMALKTMLEQKNEGIRIHLPNGNGQFFEIDMVQFNILATGFKVNEEGENGRVTANYNSGLYYRGVVNGMPGSFAAFSFFENEMYGVFSIPGVGNYSITPNTMIAARGTDYILYNDADLKIIRNTPECKSDEMLVERLESNLAGRNVYNNCKDVEVMLTADYATYVSRSSSSTNVANYLTSIFNVLSVIYRNEGIYTSIKSLNVNTASDDYQSLAQSSTAFLDKFGQLTMNNLGGADLAHLVSTRYNGTMGGVAWLDVLCYNYNASQFSGPYAFSNIYANETIGTFPTYTWNVEVLTHEMGHNLGSNHTHNCTAWSGGPIDGCAPTYNAGYAEGTCANGPLPSGTVKGTIMSYCHLLNYVGISFSNGFGPQPGNFVRNRVSTRTCVANYVPDTTMTITNTTLNATRECTNSSTGLTYYWNDNNTIDKSDDRIVLKLNKGSNNIGTLDDAGFAVKTVTLLKYGTNTGTSVTFPYGTPNIGADNIAMNRYWDVNPITQPTTAVEVYFPFVQQDINDVAGSMPSVVNHTNLKFYKMNVDPNPANGFPGATTSGTTVYNYSSATIPTATNWTYTNVGNSKYARFLVNSFSGGGGFGATGTPVPMTLLWFKGFEKEGNIELNWEVASEKNIKEYMIEKSLDAIHFKPIIFVASRNAESELYKAIDNDAKQGYNYYRLTEVSMDGTKKIVSNTQVFIKNASSDMLSIFPNPASSSFNVRFNGTLVAGSQLRLMDVSGKLIYKQSLNQANTNIDVSQVAKGIYMVQIKNGTTLLNQKIVIE